MTCSHEAAEIQVEKLPVKKMPGLHVFRLMAKCATCKAPFEFLGPLDGNPLSEPVIRGDVNATIIEMPAVAKGTPRPRIIIPQTTGDLVQ